jgi:outer membrane receptor protein involved in Fe transport
LVSSPGKFEWLLGGFYTHEKDPDSYPLRGTDPSGVVLPQSSPYFDILTYNNSSIFKEKAVFGDLTYHLTDQLEGTSGMRYSSNNQSFDYTQSGLFTIGSPPQASGASSDSAKTYLATITYKPTTEMSVYFRAASAYRPGGPNIVNAIALAAGAPAVFGPDKLWDYEAGIKGTLWDRRITYSADVYHMNWSDIQLNVIINGATVVANASSAKSNGVEASLRIVPVDNLTVSINGAYNDAKLTADAPMPINATNGDRLPNGPKITAAAVVDYRLTPFNGLVPRAGFTYAYRGSQLTGFGTSAGLTIPSYATLDLRGGVDWSRYTLIARIENVANKYALTDVAGTASPDFALGGIVLKPRTFGISFAAHF